jgi:hypothetical protein
MNLCGRVKSIIGISAALTAFCAELARDRISVLVAYTTPKGWPLFGADER